MALAAPYPSGRSDDEAGEGPDVLPMTVTIVGSYVGRHSLPADELPDLIAAVHSSLVGLATAGPVAPAAAPEPAASVRRSVRPDRLICLNCGAGFQALRRHIGAEHGLSPEAYRAMWALPSDYPMTAPNYAARRSEMARSLGLGRRGRTGG
jgi:predicted transcriptional regulator